MQSFYTGRMCAVPRKINQFLGSFCSQNGNKLKDYVVDQDIDMTAITET